MVLGFHHNAAPTIPAAFGRLPLREVPSACPPGWASSSPSASYPKVTTACWSSRSADGAKRRASPRLEPIDAVPWSRCSSSSRPAPSRSSRRAEGGKNRWRIGTVVANCLLVVGALMRGGALPALAEDELAQYAKDGNRVGVDAKCFVDKCSLPTKACMHNPDCLKGISCLSKCKGEGTCSTACFAKYGSPVLDDFLHCAVEKQDCVHVPRDESRATWKDPDAAGASKIPVSSFKIASLEGQWYKVMGMDARYDCFDCQVNRFSQKPGQDNIMMADVQFRMPRQRNPGFWENHITEELIGDGPGARRSMHSVGRMFGLTFWENWYVIGENDEDDGLPPFKFVYYTGHTLQGNYEGAFVYARTPELPAELEDKVSRVARSNGIDPHKFCKIRNACFREPSSGSLKEPAGMVLTESSTNPLRKWMPSFLSQKIIQLTSLVTAELTDWFEDPSTTSDWLLQQQERVVLRDSTMLPSSATAAAAAAATTNVAGPPSPSPAEGKAVPTSILARGRDEM